MADDAAALVVQLEARITQFEQQMNKAVRGAYGAASKIEAAFAASNDNIGRKIKGPSGFGKVISSSIDEAGSKLKEFSGRAGSASTVLEGLGVAGIAAGVGLGAIVTALAQAKAAMEFADELSDQAAKLSINVERLQEYRLAVRSAGGEVRDADAALQAFNTVLGQAQAGYAKPLKVFEALGFTKEQLDQVRSGEELLPQIADKVRDLGSEAQRAAFLDKLGLLPMKPLLEQGAEGMRNLMQAQRDMGAVMDQETIAKAGLAHDKLEELATVIDVRLKSAFATLTPAIADAGGELAQLITQFDNWFSNPELQRRLHIVSQLAGGMAKGGLYGGWKALFNLDYARDVKVEDIKSMLDNSPTSSAATRPPSIVELPKVKNKTAKDKAVADGRYAGGGGRLVDVNSDTVGYQEPLNAFVAKGGLQTQDARLRVDSTFQAAGEAMRDAEKSLAELRDRTYRGTYEATYGALDAAFRDGGKGVLRYFLEQLKIGLIQSIATSITQSAMRGGAGGIMSTFAKFAGFFADGGDIPAGQWGIAGEKGAELVKGPATVLSNTDTMKALTASAARPVAMPSASPFARSEVKLTINLEGANGDETIRRIAYDAAAQGFAAARVAAKSDFSRRVKNSIP